MNTWTHTPTVFLQPLTCRHVIISPLQRPNYPRISFTCLFLLLYTQKNPTPLNHSSTWHYVIGQQVASACALLFSNFPIYTHTHTSLSNLSFPTPPSSIYHKNSGFFFWMKKFSYKQQTLTDPFELFD